MRDKTYIVYSYRYNNMVRPRVDAQRRTFKDHRDLDSLPPVVIKWVNVAADSKREAIAIGKRLVIE